MPRMGFIAPIPGRGARAVDPTPRAHCCPRRAAAAAAARGRRRIAIGLLVAGVAAGPAGSPGTPPDIVPARGSTDIEIRPGPLSITEDEKRIAADPGRGAEHAVILVDETERDDGGDVSVVAYHRRARILSNEGRDLASVMIPFNRQEGILAEWWGRTILPDGTVLELKPKDLVEHTIAKFYGYSNRVLKGLLPGVTPGCVIDYGYVFRWRRAPWWARVPIQKRWPVREFRYRWVPSRGYGSTWDLRRSEGLDVTVSRDTRSILVQGEGLPAIVPEVWMPPEEEAGAALYVSYSDSANNADDFWRREAKLMEARAAAFADAAAVRAAVSRMALPAAAGPIEKARLAYDWMTANIRNLSAGAGVELEARRLDEERPGAQAALDRREAAGIELDFLFLEIARHLGAPAHLLLAADRTDHYLVESLLTMDQFDWLLVALRAPGEGGEEVILVDAGSGLPFGEVPWWLTGVRGLLAVPGRPAPIQIPPSSPRRNVSETRAGIAFRAEDEGAVARWSRKGTGQHGHRDLWMLRGMSLEQRRKALAALCGGGAGLEVSRAEAPVIDEPGAPFEVECEAEIHGGGPRREHTEFTARLAGPWIEAIPEFPSEKRVLPIVFPFLRTEITSLDVAAPEGFRPGPAPEPVRMESAFGSYVLSVTPTGAGYHVERVLTSTALGVPASDYGALRAFLADVRLHDHTPLEFRRSGGPT